MSTPTATPRTDAECIQIYSDDVTGCSDARDYVDASFARELETELAAAKAEAAHYMSVAQKATDDLARLRADNLTAHQMACAAGLERDRLRADLERFTGHGLLDCHAICDQRDALAAERDRLRAEVERLKADVSRETTVCDTACMQAQRLRAEVERLTKQIKDDNRSYGCELRDPNGTIWEQAAKDHARAERAEAALAFIASNGGTTHETECGPIACNGSWCAEQARAAIDAAMKGTP